MPKCNKCEKQFPNRASIDGVTKNLCNRKYCLDCSPWKSHNTRKLHDSDSSRICENCHKTFEYDRSKGHRKTKCNSCLVHACQKARKKRAVDMFGGKCSRCGYDKCIGALDFHHIGEKTESASYAIMSLSWEKVVEELKKCILVCSNCHREIHYDNKPC